MTPAVLLTLMTLTATPLEEAATKFEEQTISYTGGKYQDEEFRYRLLKPAKIEPGKKYPVVLFLHGKGERGADNLLQLKYLPQWMAEDEYRERFPCFLVAPQCRDDGLWVEVDLLKPSHTMPAEAPNQLKAAVAALDEVMKEHPVDPDRQYLTGLSMGGFGTYDLAMRMPDRFAAIAPVCGGADLEKADLIAKIPTFIYHGAADPVIKVERSRSVVDALRKAGGEPKYRELPDVGHDSWTAAYKDEDGILPWLFQQRRER